MLILFSEQHSDLRLLVKILPGPTGSEGLLPKGFSVHLALIMLLLRNLTEEMGQSTFDMGL